MRLVSTFLTLTLAPGTTARLVSMTVPVTLASNWAKTVTLERRRAKRRDLCIWHAARFYAERKQALGGPEPNPRIIVSCSDQRHERITTPAHPPVAQADSLPFCPAGDTNQGS